MNLKFLLLYSPNVELKLQQNIILITIDKLIRPNFFSLAPAGIGYWTREKF